MQTQQCLPEQRRAQTHSAPVFWGAAGKRVRLDQSQNECTFLGSPPRKQEVTRAGPNSELHPLQMTMPDVQAIFLNSALFKWQCQHNTKHPKKQVLADHCLLGTAFQHIKLTSQISCLQQCDLGHVHSGISRLQQYNLGHVHSGISRLQQYDLGHAHSGMHQTAMFSTVALSSAMSHAHFLR